MVITEDTEIDWDMLDGYWVTQYEEDYGQFISDISCKHPNIAVTSIIETRVPLEIS